MLTQTTTSRTTTSRTKTTTHLKAPSSEWHIPRQGSGVCRQGPVSTKVVRQRRRVEPQPGDDPQARTRGRASLYEPEGMRRMPDPRCLRVRPGADLYVVLGTSTPGAACPWQPLVRETNLHLNVFLREGERVDARAARVLGFFSDSSWRRPFRGPRDKYHRGGSDVCPAGKPTCA